MKEKELRESANCVVCGKPFGHTGLPLFWRVTVERIGVDMKALERLQGLTMMLNGNAALASIMGLDEDLARPMMEPVRVTICETCAMGDVCIPVLAEIQTKTDDENYPRPILGIDRSAENDKNDLSQG